LEASIPSSTASSTLALKDPNVKKLKLLIEDLNKILVRRLQLLEEIKAESSADHVGEF